MGIELFKKNNKVGVAIISSSCCFPAVAPFEEKAKHIVEQAISESGVDVQFKILPVSAYYNSIPKEIVPRLMDDYNHGKISAPPILIDGKAVFFGVPGLDEMKKALLQAAEAKNKKEGHTHESEAKSTNIA